MINQILWTALVTPFIENSFLIDYESLKKCLLFQEQEGNGIILFGSTGESLSLSKDEKVDILNFISNLNLSIPIISGVPSYNFSLAIDWIRICRDYNINGFLASTPIYTKPGVAGQIKWFESLLDISHLPMMLYNIPSRVGVQLYPAVVQFLKDHDKLYAIKDSSGSLDFLNVCQELAPNIFIYAGDDEMILEMALQGARGLVSVVSNVFAKNIRKYVISCLSNNFIDVDLTLWREIFYLLKQTVNPISIKALLKDLKLINFDTVRLPLSQEDCFFRDILLEKCRQMLQVTKEDIRDFSFF